MRKMYETQEDLAREQQIIGKICKEFSCGAYKNPCPPYKIDWSLHTNGTIFAMVEVKSSPKKFRTYRLALHKYRDMMDNARHVKTYIAISLPDGIYYRPIDELKPLQMIWWVDSRRRDITDSEPAFEFDWEQFIKIEKE